MQFADEGGNGKEFAGIGWGIRGERFFTGKEVRAKGRGKKFLALLIILLIESFSFFGKIYPVGK